MVSFTFSSLLNSEGWLDLESHESDLRGSRGVCLAGLMMLYMGLSNFRNTITTLMEKSSRRRTRSRSRSYQVCFHACAIKNSCTWTAATHVLPSAVIQLSTDEAPVSNMPVLQTDWELIRARQPPSSRSMPASQSTGLTMGHTQFQPANVGWQWASFLQLHQDPCIPQREVGQVESGRGRRMCHTSTVLDAEHQPKGCLTCSLENHWTSILHGHDLLHHR